MLETRAKRAQDIPEIEWWMDITTLGLVNFAQMSFSAKISRRDNIAFYIYIIDVTSHNFEFLKINIKFYAFVLIYNELLFMKNI